MTSASIGTHASSHSSGGGDDDDGSCSFDYFTHTGRGPASSARTECTTIEALDNNDYDPCIPHAHEYDKCRAIKSSKVDEQHMDSVVKLSRTHWWQLWRQQRTTTSCERAVVHRRARPKIRRIACDYMKPFGVIKCFELVSSRHNHKQCARTQIFGVAFATVLSVPAGALPSFDHNFRTPDDNALRFLLYTTCIYTFVGTFALLICNLFVQRTRFTSMICAKKCDLMKLMECVHAMQSMILYFITRYYCARYYGTTGKLYGRMLILMLLAWMLVSVYIIESFVQFGVSLHCGGSVHRHGVEALSAEYTVTLRQAMKLV